jgi:hypothetical protein
MVDNILRVALSERLTRAAHWTVFTVGALALSLSIIATAASAL